MRIYLALALLLTYLTGLLAARGPLRDCLAESKILFEDFSKVMKNKLLDVKENIKCALKCALVKDGYMDAQGNILIDKKVHIDNSPMTTCVKKSSEVTKAANPCETALTIYRCFQNNSEPLRS